MKALYYFPFCMYAVYILNSCAFREPLTNNLKSILNLKDKISFYDKLISI